MSNQYTLSALIGVARTLGRSHNIDVTVSGTAACSSQDEKGRWHINIPVLKENPDAFDLARGYIDHESGHALLTDMRAEKNASVEYRYRGAFHNIVNILEDGRIERRMSELYPGCKRNLQRLNDILMSGLVDKEKDRDAWQRIADWMLLETLAQNQNSMRPLADKAKALIDSSLAGALMPDIQSAVVAKNTSAVVEIAEHALQTVRQFVKGDQDQAGDQDKESQGTGNQGGQGQGQGQDQGNSPAGPEERAEIDQGMQNDSGESRKSQALQEALSESADRSAAYDANAGRGAGDHCRCITDLTDKDLTESLAAAAQLSAKMTTLLQAAERERRLPSRHGRLNTRALHKASYDPRMFLTNTDAMRLNTEIIILADVSGSMWGTRIDLMNKAIYAVVHCLRRMRGITSSVYCFDDVADCVLPANKPLTKRLQLETNGGTAMGSCVLWTMQRFGRDRTRRILLVMTDGQTCDPALMEKAIQCARENGIEIYGLGMQTNSLSQYDMPSEYIGDMRELSDAMFRMLQGALI